MFGKYVLCGSPENCEKFVDNLWKILQTKCKFSVEEKNISDIVKAYYERISEEKKEKRKKTTAMISVDPLDWGNMRKNMNAYVFLYMQHAVKFPPTIRNQITAYIKV